jgi:hypothetical protein
LTIIPVASFPRVFLPLSWLVGSNPRVFTTHAAEGLARIIGLGVVMVAKVEGEKSMVIIERVDERAYSMCLLRKDLKIKDVRAVAKMSRDKELKLEVKQVNAAMPVEGNEWWKNMAVQALQTDFNRQITLKFLSNDTISEFDSLSKMVNLSRSMEMAIDPPSEGMSSRHDSEFSADSGYISLNESPTNPIHTIKSQYLEALYSTKTSLAYFAKSSLSRARSEHTSGDESLISVLSHLILLDDYFTTKYESAVPSFVKDDEESSACISDEERQYLSLKFSKHEEVDHQSTTAREISDLKIREYPPHLNCTDENATTNHHSS